MHSCRAITSQELQNHSGTAHVAGVLQWMDTSSWEKTGWKVKEHLFQSMQRAGYNKYCFAWNKWQDSQDLMGKDQRTVQHGWCCARWLLQTSWSRRGKRRSLHLKAGGSFTIAGPGTHWGLKTLLSAGKVWSNTSTPGDFLSVFKMISWCKWSMNLLVKLLCWTCCSQTRKNPTETWKLRVALATATMKLWSLKSWEKSERQIVQCTVQDPVHTVTTGHFRRADFSLFRDLLGRISWKTTTEGEGKACESWLIFKDNLLKAQEGQFLHAGIQAGLTMDQHERKGNLWLSSNAKQSTWKVEAGVGRIYRRYLIMQGWS